MSPAPCVIFDMDGTLLTLKIDIEEVRRRLAVHYQAYGVSRGYRPILESIRAAAEQASAAGFGPVEALQEEGLELIRQAELEAARRAEARSGAVDLVARLARAGVRLGLVTNNSRGSILPALTQVGIEPGVFGLMVSREEVGAPKPAPEGLLRVIAALDAQAGCWFVGDHPIDILAARGARAAGAQVQVAGLLGGAGSEQALVEAGPDVLLTEVADVAGLPGVADVLASA